MHPTHIIVQCTHAQRRMLWYLPHTHTYSGTHIQLRTHTHTLLRSTVSIFLPPHAPSPLPPFPLPFSPSFVSRWRILAQRVLLCISIYFILNRGIFFDKIWIRHNRPRPHTQEPHTRIMRLDSRLSHTHMNTHTHTLATSWGGEAGSVMLFWPKWDFLFVGHTQTPSWTPMPTHA